MFCKTEQRKADSTHKHNAHALDAHAYARIYTHAMKWTPHTLSHVLTNHCMLISQNQLDSKSCWTEKCVYFQQNKKKAREKHVTLKPGEGKTMKSKINIINNQHVPLRQNAEDKRTREGARSSVCMSEWVSVCVYVNIYICMCVCVGVYIYTYTYIHLTYIHTYIHIYYKIFPMLDNRLFLHWLWVFLGRKNIHQFSHKLGVLLVSIQRSGDKKVKEFTGVVT